MTIDSSQFEALREVYPSASIMHDGAYSFVFVPDLRIEVGNGVRSMDALLCPELHSGYTTRLFLAQPIAERPTINGQPANWTQHPILGRLWHSWSWQGVAAEQPLWSMLASHLAALR